MMGDNHENEESTLKVGDIVIVDAGGRPMTVMEEPKDGNVLCRWWWDVAGGYFFETFPTQVVKLQQRRSSGC